MPLATGRRPRWPVLWRPYFGQRQWQARKSTNLAARARQLAAGSAQPALAKFLCHSLGASRSSDGSGNGQHLKQLLGNEAEVDTYWFGFISGAASGSLLWPGAS